MSDGTIDDGPTTTPTRTKVPMPVASMNDPHLGDAAKHPAGWRRSGRHLPGGHRLRSPASASAYWQNWNPWVLGGTMGVGLFLLGFGLTAWGKYLMPQGPFVEERHVLASSPEERDLMAAALVERSSVVVKRRKLLGGLFALGSGIFGIVALFPLHSLAGPAARHLPRRDRTGARERCWSTPTGGRCTRPRWWWAAS